MIGEHLGHYEIVSALGKGGMGEVWRARDTKLGREVAIKTLPEEFARDSDRLSRFEREARLLASLNHSNIAAIHGLEEHDGARFLVLELVEGPTLADRIGQGAIPVEESLDLALQIAEAVEDARLTYTLGFYPTIEDSDTEFHELRVEVARSGVEVRHRSG